MRAKTYKAVLMVIALTILSISFGTDVFANKNGGDEMEFIYTSDILGDQMPDETIEIHRKEGEQTSPLLKDPTVNPYREYDIALVEGGNMDAINPLATKQYIAKADVTENVGEAGKEFEIFLDEDENGKGTVKQTRQFVTFTTKSGKILHLIIDHEKTSQNVTLLTEVGEQDLLNMIEGDKSNFNTKPIEKELPKEIDKEEVPVEPKPKEKSKLSFPVILIIFGAVIGGGYYFKIYKANQEDYDDEYDDEDELEYDEGHEDEFEE